AGAVVPREREIERRCEEQWSPPPSVVAAYAALRARRAVLDPRSLSLPPDTPYTEGLEIEWIPIPDLATGRSLLVPRAAFCGDRRGPNIFSSPSAARRVRDTRGLASGPTLEEAVLHALCGLIERHAT